MRLTPDDILQARKTLEGIAKRTPLTYSPSLSRISAARVYLKWENQQETGSFKLRGAYHTISSLAPKERARGVVTASAGNHGAAVAFVARRHHVPATIVVPETAQAFKIARCRDLGAEVVVEGATYDDSFVFGKDFAARHGKAFVPATEGEGAMAGQGTIAFEILADRPETTTLVVPVGGGGLIIGMAVWAKHANPSIRIIGAQSTAARTAHDSFHARRLLDLPVEPTLADGLASGITPENLELLLRYVDDIVLAREEDLRAAIEYVWREEGQVIEGSAAVGPAALLEGRLPLSEGETAVILISGGNLDPALVSLT